MNRIPEHRALFGVDVVGAARNEGHHLTAVRQAVDMMVEQALRRGGIGSADVLEWETTGDGALLTLPSGWLGALLDVAHHLDTIAEEHNRWYKPDIRFRIAVEVGPVGPQPGLYEPKIAHARLLGAPAFKELFARCAEHNPDTTTCLILSEQALRAVFGGGYTRYARRSDFAPVPVRHKEFVETAWVRVPGFDARSIREFAARAEPRESPATPHSVTNTVHGTMNGVQAGTITGGVHIGGPR
ncbi:hypothetical protein [Saccharothrix coeruleofusca]|uniref:Uncharacterized protein n=1 Tax=Saccharothrix coeruleofusca TaxID=33919 RepID=A0A918AHA4_9PSEU|nr:hypothetical protein [Saccharothrix coeruleofusca]GGP41966.1 hypothetical protein GCM10010185_11550 [Saccharothrix coeruleofusca]